MSRRPMTSAGNLYWRDVRFIHVCHAGGGNGLATDKPIAGLIADLSVESIAALCVLSAAGMKDFGSCGDRVLADRRAAFLDLYLYPSGSNSAIEQIAAFFSLTT